MSHRVGAWLAWSVWALTVPTTILTLFFASLNEPSSSLWDKVLLPVLILAFSTVGALVASYRPENAIGWLFLSGAFVWIVGEFTLEYGVYALITDPGALPAGVWAAWFGAGAGSGGSLSLRSYSCCFLRGGCPLHVGVRSCGGLWASSCFPRYRLGFLRRLTTSG
jgi:lipopolysaccharide export LptBFGC system permease protein LptF